MNVREATRDDAEAVRTVVERSMATSYALAPATIEAAVQEWFGAATVAEMVDDDARGLLVAERGGDDGGNDDGVVGVADVAYVPDTATGEVLWLHVHPDHRGEGLGRALFERGTEWLEAAGADRVRGLVLADNADGNAFYRELGFDCVGEREVEVDGTAHTERVYHADGRDGVSVLQTAGREVYVDEADPRDGSIGPFYVAYAGPDCSQRYGYQCGHCDALATAMDSMGRIECEACGNTRKPRRWDAAYM